MALQAPPDLRRRARHTVLTMCGRGSAGSTSAWPIWKRPQCGRNRSCAGRLLIWSANNAEGYGELREEKDKAFFFEKKKQKTFISSGRCRA
jgi:hypothetical protein